MNSEPTEEQARLHRLSDATRAAYPGQSSDFDSFEDEAAEWPGRLQRCRNIARRENDRWMVEDNVTARRQVAHILGSVSIRVIDLTSGLMLLINESQVHAAFAVARALVETTAVPAYIKKNVMPSVAKGRAEKVDEVLMRLALGTDPGMGWDRKYDPIPVGSMVRALSEELDAMLPADAEELGVFRKFYSSLSDYAHPNFSAQHATAVIGPSGMRWTRARRWDGGVHHDLLLSSSLALYFGRRALDDVLATAKRHPLTLKK